MKDALVKYQRLIVAVLGIIALVWALNYFKAFVVPFAAGLILAYLIQPLVFWLERHLPPRGKWPGFKRVISILLVFVVILVLICVFFYIIVSTVVNASRSLVQEGPALLERIQQWSGDLISGLPAEIQQVINQELAKLSISTGEIIHNFILNSISPFLRVVNVIVSFAVVPFSLFFLLKDAESLKNGLAASLPARVACHGRNIVTIVENVLGRYIRYQGMMGLIVGFATFIGLLLLRAPYPLALGLISGITELIPTVGPWIGGGIAVFVTLAIAPEKAIWVAVLALAIQLLENYLLVPRIQGAYLRLHPLVTIILLVFGAYIGGVWGMLLICPTTATLIEILKYVRYYKKELETPRY